MNTIHRPGQAGFWGILSLVFVACGGTAGSEPGQSGSPVGQSDNAGQQGGHAGTASAGSGNQGGWIAAPPGGEAGGSGKKGGSAGSGPGGGGQAGSGGGAKAAYDGKGFVVHEWGTNTIVVGSDGSMQRGLHHEEEDLPGFVYDRLKAGSRSGVALNVNGKMETPVTYFYSDKPLKVSASVQFPQGVFTQWYPAVKSFYPYIFGGYPENQGYMGYMDPVLDPKVPFQSAQCQATYSKVGQGLLDWGIFSVLGPEVDEAGPDASLDKYSWSYARQVKANSLQLSSPEDGPQREKFLFYRGLGNITLPVRVTVAAGGAITLTDTDVQRPVGATFVLNVGATKAAFHAFPGGFDAGQPLADLAPSLDDAAPLDTYVTQLSASVTAALDATGLYHDEAVAMVNTWSRQWFRTPGLRVLYLLPPALTEEQIPLTITPKPDEMVRVMMIRAEVITPEQEASDVATIPLFGCKTDDGHQHFLDLGRFAEPRLRRAIDLAPESDGKLWARDFLAKISTAETRSMTGE
jgi:hypothetical protein